jgi:hypothetical protein
MTCTQNATVWKVPWTFKYQNIAKWPENQVFNVQDVVEWKDSSKKAYEFWCDAS